MRETIYRQFDWASLRQFLLLDAERVRIGEVVDVVGNDGASNVFVKVRETSEDRRTLLIDTASIGIIGDGWAMLDHPLRSAGASFQEVLGDPAGDTDVAASDEDPEVDEQETGEPLDVVYATCPHCGSASHPF